MRIWWVDPEHLDSRRLIAAHSEIHAIFTGYDKRVSKAFDNQVALPTFNWDFLKGEQGLQLVKFLHDVVLINELKSRNYPSGFNHTTPLEYTIKSRILFYDEQWRSLKWSKVLLMLGIEERRFLQDHWDLQQRWRTEIARDKPESKIRVEREQCLSRSIALFGDLEKCSRP